MKMTTLIAGGLLAACALLAHAHTSPASAPVGATAGAPPAARAKKIPTWGYQVVHAYPHDLNAFTEGLSHE